MTKVFLILRANDFGLAHVQLSKVFWETEINKQVSKSYILPLFKVSQSKVYKSLCLKLSNPSRTLIKFFFVKMTLLKVCRACISGSTS